MMAELDEDDDATTAIVARAAQLPRYEVHRADALDIKPRLAAVLTSAPAASPAPAPVDHVSVAVAAAVRNGWRISDLEGTGENNNPGPLGGLSAVTGLTLAQMALCVPPPTWAEASDESYPWQLDGWRPPGEGFKSPSVASKVEPAPEPAAEEREEKAELDPDGDTTVEPGTVEDPEALAAAVEAGDIAPIEDGVGPELAEEAGAPAAYEGTAGQFAASVKLVEDLRDKKGGDTPSMQQANHYLRKAELPTLTKAEYDALIPALSTTSD